MTRIFSSDAHKIYLDAGLDFLGIFSHRVEDLTPKALDNRFKSYTFEPGVTSPIGQFNQLWKSQDDYLAQLLTKACNGSLEQLRLRTTQIRSGAIEKSVGLDFWFSHMTMTVVLKFGRHLNFRDTVASFINQMNRPLRGLGLTQTQCLALWGLRLQGDLTGRPLKREQVALVISNR